MALHLTPGHAHDGRQFESLYESLPEDNVLESASLDRGYDADRIRERLACDGVEAVIPPINTRSKKLHYDKALYRQRNRIERFFNKVKNFRRSYPLRQIAKDLLCRPPPRRRFPRGEKFVNTA